MFDEEDDMPREPKEIHEEIEKEEQEQIKTELQVIVAHFNQCFNDWSKRNNVSANFTWSYMNGKKTFVIEDIAKLIYKKPPSNILEKMGVKTE